MRRYRPETQESASALTLWKSLIALETPYAATLILMIAAVRIHGAYGPAQMDDGAAGTIAGEANRPALIRATITAS